MSNSVTMFTFNISATETHEIRTVTNQDDLWFIAADVIQALDLSSGTSAHFQKLDANEKATISRITLGLAPGKPMVIISESGLYKLVMRSDKPQAESFQNWVTREVLPAIRKDGAYIAGEQKLASGEMSEDEFVLKAISMLQRKLERFQRELETKDDELRQTQRVIGQHDRELLRYARFMEDVNLQQLKRDLVKAGYLYRKSSSYRVYRKFNYLFQEKVNNFTGKVDIFVTEKGATLLGHLRENDELTIKKSATRLVAA